MANNRMFLTHRPSGLAVYLGKRMGDGWYYGDGKANLREEICKFFDRVEATGVNQEDMAIAMEMTSDNEPFVIPHDDKRWIATLPESDEDAACSVCSSQHKGKVYGHP